MLGLLLDYLVIHLRKQGETRPYAACGTKVRPTKRVSLWKPVCRGCYAAAVADMERFVADLRAAGVIR